MNCAIAAAPLRPDRLTLVLRAGGSRQLDVLPRIGVAARDRREDILPLFGLDPWSDRVDESVPEYRHEVVVLQDAALNFFGQLLALVTIERFLILLEFRVEVLHADHVLGLKTAAFEHTFVPVGPAAAYAGRVHDN